MNTFSVLKANRTKQLEALNSKLTELAAPNYSSNNDDHEYWKPTVDKAGNGFAVIRFLPPPDGESIPFVQYFDHGFMGPAGQWYIEKSRTTLGQDEKDPVSEMNKKLWNSGIQANKDIVSGTPQRPGTKRRLHYVSNVYVIKDSANPDNEGKVFKYTYGKKIFDMINDKLHPQFEDEASINPFDLWEGCNFKLKIRNKDGFRSYDKSEWDTPGPLADDDEMEKIWNQCYSLQAVIAPDKFKTYEKLSERLAMVMSGDQVQSKVEEPQEEAPRQRTVQAKEAPSTDAPWDSSKNEEDDELAFFRGLAE